MPRAAGDNSSKSSFLSRSVFFFVFFVPQKTKKKKTRFVEKYDMTLSDLAKAELGGHFKEAVLSWIDPVADPTRGLEQVN